MPINDFCDNFLTKYLNKIALLDNTWILMGDLNNNLDLLKSQANNVASKFLEVMTSCFLFLIFSNLHVLLVHPQH